MATIKADVQTTEIITATTTTILDARAGATDRARVRKGMISIYNKGTGVNNITLRKSDGSLLDIVYIKLPPACTYTNAEWTMVFKGTTDILQLISSTADALEVVVTFIEETA